MFGWEFGKKIVGSRQSHRSEDQPHQIMHVKPASIDTRDTLREPVDPKKTD